MMTHKPRFADTQTTFLLTHKSLEWSLCVHFVTVTIKIFRIRLPLPLLPIVRNFVASSPTQPLPCPLYLAMPASNVAPSFLSGDARPNHRRVIRICEKSHLSLISLPAPPFLAPNETFSQCQPPSNCLSSFINAKNLIFSLHLISLLHCHSLD